jgi:Domain of unknown function (DUF4258)
MKIIFRIHAIQRMFERTINVEDIRSVINEGETIESYPNDLPYPSRLILGWSGKRPIHLVVADNPDEDQIIVITVYEPDASLWDAEYKRRR